MPTITSAASGNANVGATWVGGVAPGAGDHVIIAGHTITFTVDVAYLSLTLNNVASRILYGGAGTRLINVAGNITRTATASATTCNLTSGQTLRIRGQHVTTVTQTSYFFGLTSAELFLESPGASTDAYFARTETNVSERVLIVNASTGNNVVVTGRVLQNSTASTLVFSLLGSGAFSWNWTGDSYFGNAVTSKVLTAVVSAATTVTISGGTFSNWVPPTSTGVFVYSGALLTVVETFSLLSYVPISVASVALMHITTSDVTHNGLITHPSSFASLGVMLVSGFFRYKNQTLTIAAGREFSLLANAGTVDFGGLVANVAGDFLALLLGPTGFALGTGCSLVQTAVGAVIGVNYAPVTITYLEATPATLPPAQKVQAGEVYGRPGIELTGTGLIVDPATIAAGVTTGLNTISATALARFATVDTGQTAAVAGSVAILSQGGGGLTPEIEAQIDLIEAQTSKLSGTPVIVNGNVKPGGQIVLKHGDDHTVALGNPVIVPVDDVGGALHTLMAAVGVGNLSVVAIRGVDPASRVSGTVAALSYSSNVLSVTMQFTAAETVKGVVGPAYNYDVIKTATPTRTYFSGRLTLTRDAR